MQTFDRSANTLSKVSVVGILLLVAGLLGLAIRFAGVLSRLVPQVDALYFFVLAVTAFFAILVVVFVVVFAVKYRDRTGERLGTPIHGSIMIELGWSIIPFLIAMVIFVWATVMFFQIVRPSAETLEIL